MKPQNSKNTSINNRLPALYKKLDSLYLYDQLATADIDAIIDYGCGRYPEHVKQWALDRDKVLYQFDPYWDVMRSFNPEKKRPKTFMLCLSNVLNVCVDWKRTLTEAINYPWAPVEGPHLIVIKVYEGNGSCEGKWSSKGYQQNMPLCAYWKECSEHFGGTYWWFMRNGLLIGERLK